MALHWVERLLRVHHIGQAELYDRHLSFIIEEPSQMLLHVTDESEGILPDTKILVHLHKLD